MEKTKTLKTKHDIVQMARRIGLLDFDDPNYDNLLSTGFGWPTKSGKAKPLKEIDPSLDGVFKEKVLADPELETIFYERIMATFDSKGDGEISLDEMVVGMSIVLKGTRAERAELIFNIIDTNGDGVIDFQEMVNLQQLYSTVLASGLIVIGREGLMPFLKKKFEDLSLTFSQSQVEEFIVKAANTLRSAELVQFGAKLCMNYADANADGHVTKEEYIGFYSNLDSVQALHNEMEKAIQPIIAECSLKLESEVQQFLMDQIRTL